MLPKTLLITTLFINKARLMLTVVNNFLLKFKHYAKKKRDQLCFFTVQRIRFLIVGGKTGIACS